MKSSIQLLRIADIPIRLHWSFVFLLIWIGYIAYDEQLSTQQTGYFFLMILGLFVCVICHEYGHALMARYYGIRTRDIFILPIGGLARLESMPMDPRKELIIAMAGPLVNVVIALVLLVFAALFGTVYFMDHFRSIESLLHPMGLVYSMIFLNILLFFFNLIPAYPMDGGRILRSALSLRFGKRKATIFVSYLAQIIGLIFFFWGLLDNHFTIMLIGVFIFFTSRWERRAMILHEMRMGEEE